MDNSCRTPGLPPRTPGAPSRCTQSSTTSTSEKQNMVAENATPYIAEEHQLQKGKAGAAALGKLSWWDSSQVNGMPCTYVRVEKEQLKSTHVGSVHTHGCHIAAVECTRQHPDQRAGAWSSTSTMKTAQAV